MDHWKCKKVGTCYRCCALESLGRRIPTYVETTTNARSRITIPISRKGNILEYFGINNPLYRRLIIVFERNPVQYFPVNYLATSEYASSRKRSRLRIADETAKGETRLSGQWRFRAGHRSKGNVFRPLFSPPWLCKDRQAVIALKDWNVRPLSPRPLSRSEQYLSLFICPPHGDSTGGEERARLKWPPEVSTIGGESISLVITDRGEKWRRNLERRSFIVHAWSSGMFGVKLTIAPPRLV